MFSFRRKFNIHFFSFLSASLLVDASHVHRVNHRFPPLYAFNLEIEFKICTMAAEVQSHAKCVCGVSR